MTVNLTRSRYIICVADIHEAHISVRFGLPKSRFDLETILFALNVHWRSALNDPTAPNDPKMTLRATRSNVPHTFYQCPRIPNFTPLFCPTTSRCQVTGHYETRAPNETKMMNPIRSKVPHICNTYNVYTRVPNLVRFALRPLFFFFFFQLQDILRRVHRMTQKWPWTIQGQMYPVYVLLVLVSPIPTFRSVLLSSQLFWVTRHFEKSAWSSKE